MFARLPGVENLAVGPNRLTVCYYPQVTSSETLRQEIVRLGYIIDQDGQKPPARPRRLSGDVETQETRFFWGISRIARHQV